MKMLKKIVSFALIISITASIYGCDGANQNVIDESIDFGVMDPELKFSLTDQNVLYMTVSDKGELYAVTENKGLGKYSRDGKLIEGYKNANNLSNLCYTDNKIYAYDYENKQIVAYDIESKKQLIISDKFDFDIMEIKDLTVIDDCIYILVVPMPEFDDEHLHFGDSNEFGYSDYEEKLYRVSIIDGSFTDMEISNIISLYNNTDSKLYYYSFNTANESYELNLLNTESGKTSSVAKMDDVGYLFAFIYENGNFTYADSNLSIQNKRMSDSFITTIESEILTGPGSHVWYYNGHIIYRNIPLSIITDENINEKNTIKSIYIGFLYEDKADKENIDAKERNPQGLTAFADSNAPSLNTANLSKATGLSLSIKKGNIMNLEDLTDLMAGNSNIDIYLLLNSYTTKTMKDMGYYVPLNGSKPIENYLDNCFDYLKDFSISDNGDVWMIPLETNTDVIWYVPENFNKYNLTPEDVKYFDEYIETLKKLYNVSEQHATYGWLLYFYINCEDQYDVFYNDYKNGYINYNTDLFKKIFTTSWDGWVRYTSAEANNVLFRRPFEDSVYDANGISTQPQFDTERVIFSYDIAKNYIENEYGDKLKKWRALPAPRISPEIDFNYVNLNIALINPYSEKKELALEYLEAIASDPQKNIYSPTFTLKYTSMYNSRFDINSDVFSDLYDIYMNGKVSEQYYLKLSDSFIEDYQSGKLTFDEAIAEKERYIEMFLNE